MSEVELLVVAVAAVLTAALTAVAGAGGGVVLLVVMLQFVDPAVAIPAHGVVQLVSQAKVCTPPLSHTSPAAMFRVESPHTTALQSRSQKAV